MKIQICSDLHIDVNEKILKQKINFNFKKYPLFIAGDIGESPDIELALLKELNDLNIQTFVVGGNHLGYGYRNNRLLMKSFGIDDPLLETKEDCIKKLVSNAYNNIYYLENSYIEFDQYIVYGGTMYTDFMLYPESIEICKSTAERWLNDFRYVHTYVKEEKIVRPVFAGDYIKWNKQFMTGLNKCLKMNKNIIVLSHFAPSIKSIDKIYLNQRPSFYEPGFYLNAVYASNLENYIKQNKQIKYWIHGHVHGKKDYKIEQCRVICNPYGYYYDSQIEPQEFKLKVINI